MGLKQDMAGAEAYIARANRRIEKQHGLITRSRDRETVAAAEELVVILTTLRESVERRRINCNGRPSSRRKEFGSNGSAVVQFSPRKPPRSMRTPRNRRRTVPHHCATQQVARLATRHISSARSERV